MEENRYDVIIIGAGPAGLTSAIYTRRADKKTLVLEAKTYGGQIVNTLDIENYPVEAHISGYEFATRLYNQTLALGAEIIFEKAIQINDLKTHKEVVTDKNTYKTKTIIVATGAQNRKLGLPKEEQLIGKGISYCATCDGAFYKEKIVAVQGGGNTALEDALYLSDIANKVYVIHRRDTFRAATSIVNKLKEKENVEFILNSNVTKLNANEVLESIEVTSLDGKVTTIPVSVLFVAVGRVPANELFANLIEVDDGGYIISQDDCHTNVVGIYVAGDNRVKSIRQLVTATGDGAIAAMEAVKYINDLGE